MKQKIVLGATVTMLLILSLQACDYKITKEVPIVAAEQQTKPEEQEKKISFEVTSFNLTYDKSTDSRFYDEKYNGTGIISATGDPALVKKPYQVLIEINRTSGGDKSGHDIGLRSVTVNNGIGKFNTQDWNYDKDVKMDKPVYVIKILGFIPYTPLETINK